MIQLRQNVDTYKSVEIDMGVVWNILPSFYAMYDDSIMEKILITVFAKYLRYSRKEHLFVIWLTADYFFKKGLLWDLLYQSYMVPGSNVLAATRLHLEL